MVNSRCRRSCLRWLRGFYFIKQGEINPEDGINTVVYNLIQFDSFSRQIIQKQICFIQSRRQLACKLDLSRLNRLGVQFQQERSWCIIYISNMARQFLSFQSRYFQPVLPSREEAARVAASAKILLENNIQTLSNVLDTDDPLASFVTNLNSINIRIEV